ncbi:AbrB family transcriptional regulator [uncultured Idiomarina sp.]|uniref:AbrB/MazE/SpoVT family DNA-binding domain-containing protein n=1 Tax=uncultured Idiomarina sp. TaxID=352961 RepID=UPI0025924568|nr:AbrB family transcriptional regulator [uncultured Idiomarina sp.]
MKATIEQLGNEKGIVISDFILEAVNLGVNDTVDVKVEGRCIVIEPVREFEYSLDELLAQCTPDAMVLDKKDRAWLE